VAHLHEPVQVIKHVHVHKDTITEERIAMQKLQSEDEDLRRMCSELQRVVDETVQKVHYVSEDARHVALMARQLAHMQLEGGDQNEEPMEYTSEDEDGNAEGDDRDDANAPDASAAPGKRLHLRADVLRIEDTPAASRHRDLLSQPAEPARQEGALHGKLPPPRDAVPPTPRSGMRTPRDNIRPGTASFSPRPMIPPRLSSKPSTPRQSTLSTPRQLGTGVLLPARPNTSQNRPRTSTSATGPGVQADSRPPTAQSTASEKLRRQVLLCCFV